MKSSEIITVPILVRENMQFDVESIADGHVLSFAVKNIGTTDCTLWGQFPIAVGDGLISFEGYFDKIRKDSFSIDFFSGAGQLLILITKYAC